MFVSVKFREDDARTYTYAASEAYAPGDRVLVEVKGEQKVVFVDCVDLPEPPFACKPIIGKAPEKEVAPNISAPFGEDAQ